MANITVGPIIGNVTTTNARILAEFDQDGQMTLTVGEQSCTRQVQANRPSIFVFDGLQDYTKYTITYNSSEIGNFYTLRNQKSKEELRTAVISCNAIRYIEEHQKDEEIVWKEMAERIEKNGIDYLIHIGDQVYIDYEHWNGDKQNPYAIMEDELKDVPVEQLDDKLEHYRELCRKEYRRTWNQKYIKYCLAHCPSTMQLDDHEVVNDAGRAPNLLDPTKWQYWFSHKVVRHVYYEYQRQLIEDIDFNDLTKVEIEYQRFIIQNTGFFLMDQRAHFLWGTDKWDKDNSVIGMKQRNQFLQDLAEGGKYDECDHLMFLNSIPIVLLTTDMMQLTGHITEDSKDHWSFYHMKEVILVLDTLRAWKDRKPNRVISMCGGDIHFGAHYDVYYDDKPLCKELITSSIGNFKCDTKSKLATQIIPEIFATLPDGYKFDKHDICFDNNYGLITTKNDRNGPLVEYMLISNKCNPMVPEKMFHSREYEQVRKRKSKGGCCTTF